ncbi:MAG: hypothetical protein A3K19_21910 [Lentisphaerae bacterium RIFOXYB12_FULL_65_16]|nr:MAG: hypothetical protein A3K18_04340 [Lentisphaerae bacterium RIFOXYA12_64_32]OGV93913.1 MAG: hypothetical protein A3K19_21910 [Lentisphaerae bacterium RIFOXYB12_FULL_65_16]
MAVLGAVWAGAADVCVRANAADGGTGALEQPFRTLSQAAAVLKPGDTCVIGGGAYRETVRPVVSGEPDRPIRFAAVPGERVVVSGADVLTGAWSVHQGNIHKAAVELPVEQLFIDGRMMMEARWPNTPLDDIMVMQRAAAGTGTGYEQLADPNLPPGDWNGGFVLLWPGSQWTNATRRIVEYCPGQGFRFDRTMEMEKKDAFHSEDPFKPRAGNPYILFGSLAGLDAPGEWFYDTAARVLYLWVPDGASPATHTVEVKQRPLAFDLSKLSYIELCGLNIEAATVDMTEARNCLLDDCRLTYTEHFRETDMYKVPAPRTVVTGENNTWRHCLVAYSAGTALRIGGKGNRFENCIIRDADYSGSVAATLDMKRSEDAVVTHCSIFRGGRDIVGLGGSKRVRIEFNDIHHANMLNSDSGATYCFDTDGAGSVIAWNWVHDNLSEHTSGIYLDNFSRNFTVHHNVVWNCSATGIRTNSDAMNHLLCNNTIIGCTQPFGIFTFEKHVPTQKGTRILNNLVLVSHKPTDPTVFVQGELGPEVHHNGFGAIDASAVPTAGSMAIDAGVPVNGITDGFVGAAPDLGAYEYGGTAWRPGADWCEPRTELDLAFSPQPPVTETTMVRDGLLLWLDAAAPSGVESDAAGQLTRWLDQSGQNHHATAEDGLILVPAAMNGRPVVRSSGKGRAVVGTLRAQAGPLTAFVVAQAQAQETGASQWQRILGAWSGQGKEWTPPNWIILRPRAPVVSPFPAQIFMTQSTTGLTLEHVTVFGETSAPGHFLVGDIAEVLVYDRALRFDEALAIEDYLNAKWGLK